MKPTRLLPTLLGCILTSLPTFASPLQRSDVINDPVWVLHVDADGLRPTAIGQYLLSELAKPEAQKKLAGFQAIFSFDPSKELHGVTLYGATKAEEDGVMLVNADFDSQRLTTLAEAAKEHESKPHRQHTIHSWVDENKPLRNSLRPRTYAAIRGKVIVFAQKESRVAEALDVLDQLKPNLRANAAFAQLDAAPAFIQGAARKPELPGSDPTAAVLKQAKMAVWTVSESQNQAESRLALEADTEEIARQIEVVGRGLIGLMALQSGKPEAQKIAKGLTVQQEGLVVNVRLAMPADEVVGLLKAGAAGKTSTTTGN